MNSITTSNGNNTAVNKNSNLKAAGKGAAIGGGFLLANAAADTIHLTKTAKEFSKWTKQNPKIFGELNFKQSLKHVWETFKKYSNVTFDKGCGLQSYTTLEGTPLKKMWPILAGIVLGVSVATSLTVNAIKNAKAGKTNGEQKA